MRELRSGETGSKCERGEVMAEYKLVESISCDGCVFETPDGSCDVPPHYVDRCYDDDAGGKTFIFVLADSVKAE